MKKGLFVFFILSLCTQCKQKKEIHITEFSQKDVNNAIILDVRTPEEYAEGHLDNALNINWFDPDFQSQVESLGKSKTFYIYCKKGGRSAKASHLLDSLGYDVVNLAGGYDGYMEGD